MDEVRASLLQRLDEVRRVVGEPYLPARYEELLRGPVTEDDLRQAAGDEASPLWWFAGPVAYALYGRDGHQLAGQELRETIAVLPPPFVHDTPRAIAELQALDCRVASRQTVFTPLFAALLYGAYPWYASYVHACNALGLFGREAMVLDIVLPPTMTPAAFNREKERIRTLLSPEISIPVPGLAFPGLVRPIHSPEAIEIARHVRASRL